MALTLRISEEEKQLVEQLKSIFDVGTASKALMLAAQAFVDQREVLREVSRSHAELEARLNNWLDLEEQKAAVCDQLAQARSGSRSEFDCNIPRSLDQASREMLRVNVSQRRFTYWD